MTSAITAAILVLGVLVIGVILLSLALLARNRAGARPSAAAGLQALSNKASVLLVDLDTALAAADNELGFALAQFGEQATADYAEAVRKARNIATAAFRIRRELEDAFPEPVTKQREMTLQIIALSEAAKVALETQEAAFRGLRSAEAAAPESLTALRKQIDAAVKRVNGTKKTLARLASDYRPSIAAENENAIADAARELASARATVAAAEKGLSPEGVNAVVAELRAAEQAVATAVALLDGIDRLAAQLDESAAAVTKLVAAQKADLAEAKRERESAPDPETGAAIVDAIDSVQKALASIEASVKPSDPIANLDTLNAAVAELDTALASARNQSQRLEHARTALAGTLVSAHSQIAAVRGYINAGGGAGADARTRLSEAERELTVAEAEADPVEALDAARRAVTHARDADALARYDAMG
jgi:chromosome segregation ATPase